MFRKSLLISLASLLAFFQLASALAQETQFVDSAKTLETAEAFLWAAGSGDMEKLQVLMADDFVWHNEGDARSTCSACSLRPTAAAIRPETPESTSSNTRTEMRSRSAMASFIDSIIRDTSPPEATRAKGRSSLPKFVLI